MVTRSVALCNDEYIGIESIFTVVDGKQINIPNKVEALREKGRRNELFCPCGCGANLILVAGDKGLREQHFRIKDDDRSENCQLISEGRVSIQSKIVLKCWLDDKLNAADLESRVPIHHVDDSERMYEFSFISRNKRIAVNYCHMRANLSDEKLGILESNGKGIHIIHIVDFYNSGSEGQYPESLMKIQKRQGFCLYLSTDGADYESAKLKAAFYEQDLDGLWLEEYIAEDFLKCFDIDIDGEVLYDGHSITALVEKHRNSFHMRMQVEQDRRERVKAEEEYRKQKLREQQEAYEKARRERAEEELRLAEIRQAEEQAKEEQRKKELAEKKAAEEEERRRREEEFIKRLESYDFTQKSVTYDEDGGRWVKCEFCGKIAKESEFPTYCYSLGTCRDCSANNPAVKEKLLKAIEHDRSTYDPNKCPECGGTLNLKSGRYGRFFGCSNYPRCRYTRKSFDK